MKRLISVLLTIVMLASMLVAVIPASAATVTTTSTDKALKFKSGLNNVWSTDKKLTALPKTLEATIDVPASQYDIYEGQILAWYSASNQGHYIWVDLIRKNSTHGDLGSNLGVRILYMDGTTEVQKVFYESLNAHVGKKTHIAITFDSDINLYLNGEKYNGGSYFRSVNNATEAMAVYNGIDVSKVPALSYGGDDRLGDPSSIYTKIHMDNYRFFKGGIYNACVFSDVRTANEIKADMNSVDTATADNLVMAYDTTNLEADIREFADITGNGYDMKQTFRGKSFQSGFNNLYSSNKQVTALPKTFEATIEVPSSYSDQYWGNIFAWGIYADAGKGYDELIWDIREDTGTKQIETRFFCELNSGTSATLRFLGALEPYRGQKVHLAIVITDTVELYINGVKFTGNVNGDKTVFVNTYDQITISNLPLPAIGGDFREKIADSQWSVHHVDNFRYFRGKIFDFCAFTDARTASELAADVNTLPAKGTDNLLMCYDLFDETDAKFIPDRSGNGYNMAAPVMWTDSDDKIEITEYGYSFAVVGDTQVITRDETVQANNPYYDAKYKGSLAKLYDWIVNNAETKNIKFSFHMGDVTDWSQASEWTLAMENMSKMNGVIPYNIARGNHDGGPAMASRYTPQMFKNNVVVGEEYGFFDGRGIENYETNTLNTYQTITVNGVMYLMLALDLGPCKAVIEWANEVIEAHPYHNVIISTHSYLQGDYSNTNYAGAEHYPYMDGDKDCAANQYNPGGKYNGGSYKDANGNSVYWDYRLQQHKNGGDNYLYQDATYMLNNLVKKHDNISMVLCGHECSEYVKQISTTTESGKTVLQFLVDGQGVDHDLRKEKSHAGLVAMFYFSNDGKKVTTEYYSTIRDQYLHDAMNVNTYDVNTVEVPESVKTFYALMHSLDSKNYNSGAWAAISAKLEEVKQTVVTTSDMNEVDAAVASLQAVITATENLDYSNLAGAISAAEALNEKDYTVADWNAIQVAIATAKEALSSASQSDLDNAATTLNTFVNGKTKLDRSALTAAIEAAEAASFEYGDDDWAAIRAAIDVANGGYNARTQDEIDAFVTNLTAVINSKSKLDRTALNAAIAAAEALDFSKYTDDSWTALVLALMDARSKQSSRIQSDINAAAAALQNAIDGLVEAPVTPPATDDDNNGGENNGGENNNDANNGGNIDTDENDEQNTSGDDSDDETDSDDDKIEEGGCGSAIAASAVVLTTVLALGIGFKKKD